MDKDKINGYGSLFRFITPVLITIAIFMLTWILNDTRELKICFANHLEHHRVIEVQISERLSSIDTTLRERK